MDKIVYIVGSSEIGLPATQTSSFRSRKTEHVDVVCVCWRVVGGAADREHAVDDGHRRRQSDDVAPRGRRAAARLDAVGQPPAAAVGRGADHRQPDGRFRLAAAARASGRRPAPLVTAETPVAVGPGRRRFGHRRLLRTIQGGCSS